LSEALLRQIGGSEFEVMSAGTNPGAVNPYTIRVLSEMGIDWSAARSKSVTEFIGQRFDYVVTVCDKARQTCPVFPGTHAKLHWDLEDPAEVQGDDETKLAAFRHTRSEIESRVTHFVAEAKGN
jgi:arsenate reductase